MMIVMTEHEVLHAILSVMTPEELHYVVAFCDNRCRQLGVNVPEMEKWDERMQEAREELENRRNR